MWGFSDMDHKYKRCKKSKNLHRLSNPLSLLVLLQEGMVLLKICELGHKENQDFRPLGRLGQKSA
ncbi:hypothetical protein A4G20_00960 [Pasteurellaceae bacterium RH1A]|nr:hypothetical protein A4G20_00960 [Pasteurellaceae bacterium RH1A]